MSFPPIHRVVTGHDARGKAIFVINGPLSIIRELESIPGMIFHEVLGRLAVHRRPSTTVPTRRAGGLRLPAGLRWAPNPTLRTAAVPRRAHFQISGGSSSPWRSDGSVDNPRGGPHEPRNMLDGCDRMFVLWAVSCLRKGEQLHGRQLSVERVPVSTGNEMS